MLRAIALLCVIASLSADTGPVFEAADVHATVVKGNNQYMRRISSRNGRYELRIATMVDLISTAYGVDADKVLGGPNWLEYDVFDVIAKAPPKATADEKKAMLKALLADRFKLVAHPDTQPMPAWALTAGKKPNLKPADDSGETGCKFSMEDMGPPPPPPPPSGGGAPSQPVFRVPAFLYTCRNIGMDAFAAQMRDMVTADQDLNGNPVVDRTELKGNYDFTFKYNFAGMRAFAGPDAKSITFTDAIEKQLGLKLEPVKVPLPVLVVESVNEKPTANLADVAAKLSTAPEPTEFEVADIKPSDPEQRGMRFNIQPGGRVSMSGVNLKFVIQQAWGISSDMLIGAPSWMDTARFDIVAKAPATAIPEEAAAPGPGPGNGPGVDIETVWTMMRSLLAERFKLTTHEETQTISAYTLLPGKPKMKKADPNSRTHYKEGPAPDAKDPRKANPVLARLVNCQNMTMDQFAEKLQGIAPGYIHSPVLNSTGLDGGWDFTLNFSPAGLGTMLAGRGGRGGGEAGPGGAVGDASDPTGAVSLPEAIEKQMGLKLEQQKRPVKVLVIDHIEQKPVDN